MFPTRNVHTSLDDPNNATPISRDADGAEIYHGTATVNYEGRELVWESFRDQIAALIESESGALTLANALGLDVTRYE